MYMIIVLRNICSLYKSHVNLYNHNLMLIPNLVCSLCNSHVNPYNHNLMLIPNFVRIGKGFREYPFSLYLYIYCIQIFVLSEAFENGDIIHRKRSAKLDFIFPTRFK